MFLFFIKKLRGLFNTYLVFMFNINKNRFLSMVIMGASYVVGFPLTKPLLSNGRTNSACCVQGQTLYPSYVVLFYGDAVFRILGK